MSKIKSISIKGFKSIKNLEDFKLSQKINVLIGANGSGKSNFISFFKFLNDIIHERLSTTKFGGASRILYNGPKVTQHINSSIYFDHSDYGYAFKLKYSAPDTFDLKIRKQRSNAENYTINLTSSENQETDWKSGSDIFKKDDFFSQQIKSTFKNWIVYHFHDTTDTANIKQTCSINDNIAFAGDGRNLAAILYRIKKTNSLQYKTIVKTIEMVAPFFKDFILRELPENSNYMQLEWQSKGVDQPFVVHQFSDGTLRFICLATLLLQPNPPSTIIIDEPELGLHPYALKLLAGMLKSASSRTQIILSTQSPRLVDEFKAKDIIVMNKIDDQSVFSKLKEEDLEEWLKEYSLGDLWEKNVIGGRPYNRGPIK